MLEQFADEARVRGLSGSAISALVGLLADPRRGSRGSCATRPGRLGRGQGHRLVDDLLAERLEPRAPHEATHWTGAATFHADQAVVGLEGSS